MTAFDFVVLLVLGNAVQNAIIGNDYSLMGGLIDAAVIIVCNYFMVRVVYRYLKIKRLVEGTPTLLVKDGRIIAKHLKREAISEAELRTKLCQQGIDDISEVKIAILETDGKLTIQRYHSINNDDKQKELSDKRSLMPSA